MPATVVVIYPHTEGKSKFDLEYYLKTHMPLVQKTWASMGLQKWVISELVKSSGYSIQAVLHFDTAESLKKAVDNEAAKAIFDDIPNFSNEQPLLLTGTEVASS